MIDWDEIATVGQVRALRKQVALLTRLVGRLGDELNKHNDNCDVHTKPCDVILSEFSLAAQRGYEAGL